MIVEKKFWERLYEATCLDVHNSGYKTVIIFVSIQEVDSLAALQILRETLYQDNIKFSAYYVSSPQDISQQMDTLIRNQEEADPELWSIFFINCGATMDLHRICDLDRNKFIRCIVVDHHRPIHHSYNDDDDHSAMLIMDSDEGINIQDIPLGDNVAYEEDEENEEQYSNEERNGYRPNKRQRLSNHDWEKEFYYKNGYQCGKSSALVMYEISSMVNREKHLGLWMAIVGVTDMLVHHRLSSEKYLEYYKHLEREVIAQGIDDERRRRSSGLLSKPKQQEIRTEDDFNIPLYRHWKLYDAIQKSLYSAPRLDTFREKGDSRVENLILQIGIPLKLAKQELYKVMNVKYRKAFHSKIQRVRDYNNIPEICFHSFMFRDGVEVRMSAQDTVLMLQSYISNLPVRQQQDRTAHFLSAQQLVNSVKEYPKALKRATELQQGLHRVCCSILENKLCTLKRRVWVINMTKMIEGRDTLSQPQSLIRVCYCMHETQQFRTRKNYPVLIISPPSLQGTCLITGIQYTQVQRPNQFSYAFSQAVQTLEQGTWTQCGFCSCIYQVQLDVVPQFVKQTLMVLNDISPDEDAEQDQGVEED